MLHDCVQVLQHLAGQGGTQGTVQIPCATIKAWYEALFDQIFTAIQHSLDRAEQNGAKVDYILVVGGLSTSPYLVAELKQRFGQQVRDIFYPSVLYQTVLTGKACCCVSSMLAWCLLGAC